MIALESSLVKFPVDVNGYSKSKLGEFLIFVLSFHVPWFGSPMLHEALGTPFPLASPPVLEPMIVRKQNLLYPFWYDFSKISSTIYFIQSSLEEVASGFDFLRIELPEESCGVGLTFQWSSSDTPAAAKLITSMGLLSTLLSTQVLMLFNKSCLCDSKEVGLFGSNPISCGKAYHIINLFVNPRFIANVISAEFGIVADWFALDPPSYWCAMIANVGFCCARGNEL